MSGTHSAEDSGRYVVTIFKRLRIMTGGTALAHNLVLPFSQDGWTATDLAAGRQYAVDQGWIEVGKEEKFFKLTEAGFAQYPAVAE